MTIEGRRMDAYGGRGWPQGHAESDPVGTVRRAPDGKTLAIRLPSPPSDRDWHVQDQWGAGGHEPAWRVAHWPIVGAVPWSPAGGVPLDGSLPTPVEMTKVAGPSVVGPRVLAPALVIDQAAVTAQLA